MNAVDDPVRRALRDLNGAMKAIAFYPSHHPSVARPIERAVRTFREALAAHEVLQIGVGDAVFLLDGQPIGADDPVLSGFANYLARRGIGAVELRPSVDPGSLRSLLEVLVLDPAALRSRGGPARCLGEGGAGGVSLREFDPGAALRSARTAPSAAPAGAGGGRPGTTFNELVARFLTGQDPQAPAGAEGFLRNAAHDLEGVRALRRSVQSRARGSTRDSGELVAAALGRLAAQVHDAGPESLPSLALHLGTALQDLEPATRAEILATSIPVAGTDVDLAREIRKQIPDDRVGQMIASLVQAQGKMTFRLAAVIRKVLIDKGGVERNRAAVLEAIRAARRPGADPLSDVWASIENLLEEPQDEWLSREYRELLEIIGTAPPTLESQTRDEIRRLPEFADAFTAEGTSRCAWLLLPDLALLVPAVSEARQLLEESGTRAAAIDPGWYETAAGVCGSVRAVLDARPVPELQESGLRALRTISERVLASHRECFHRLTEAQREALDGVFEALGSHGVDPLLTSLQREEDWEIRRSLIAMLVARGRESVPVLVRHLSDPSWFLLRNILLVLGEVGDPSAVSDIARTLRHPEPRVRKEAITALGRIGGPRAFGLVRGCLWDPEVAEVAARALSAINRPRAITAILGMTDRVHLLGGRNEALRYAILALGDLGVREAVPRLEAILMRGFWVPPSSGDEVRVAASLALARIGTPEAIQALRRGSRVHRRPIRDACSAILEGGDIPAEAV
ncbi:MAG: HEAT repeat domain-containing protein [Acidobacteriota bacterium]